MMTRKTTTNETIDDNEDNDDDAQQNKPTSGPHTRSGHTPTNQPREQKMALNHALGK